MSRGSVFQPLRAPGLAVCPILMAGLHHQTLLPDRQLYGAELGDGDRLIRHVAQIVLVAQFLLQDIEHPIYGLLLRNFEKAAAAIVRHALQDALAVAASENSIGARVG